MTTQWYHRGRIVCRVKIHRLDEDGLFNTSVVGLEETSNKEVREGRGGEGGEVVEGKR